MEAGAAGRNAGCGVVQRAVVATTQLPRPSLGPLSGFMMLSFTEQFILDVLLLLRSW